MKLEITLIVLIGLTCATIAFGNELSSIQGSQLDTRSLNERANKMMMMNEPTMNQLMNQIETMQKQMAALHATLRRNHTRNLFSVRNVKDAFDEISRNFEALNSQVSRLMTTRAISSTLGSRSFGLNSAQQQQSSSSASSSANSQSLA